MPVARMFMFVFRPRKGPIGTHSVDMCAQSSSMSACFQMCAGGVKLERNLRIEIISRAVTILCLINQTHSFRSDVEVSAG